MVVSLVIIAVCVIAMAVLGYLLYKSSKEEEKPSVVQQPSKPEVSVCEGCNNFEACIACENGSRWAHILESKEEPEKPKEEKKESFDVLHPFLKIVDIKVGSKTYQYLADIITEANYQYFEGRSIHGLPVLFKEENFSQIYDFYGEDGDDVSAIKTLVGWLIAMQLAELRPQDRTAIYKIGYEMGGYDKDSKLYGWRFKYDPNICRIVAAAIYAGMRGVCKPDVETMRKECNIPDYVGTCWSIESMREDMDAFDVNKYNSLYVDLREFLPTAPGPYAPGYQDRSNIGGYPYPNDAKTDDYNLAIDRAIRDYIVETYKPVYMDNYKLRTVQAIADKDADCNHLFGKTRQVEQYWFEPVFTKETLGQEVYPSLAKELCYLVDDVLHIGSYQRCILQGNDNQETPPQYGRLRPGCSWNVEAHRHSDTDDTQNVLVDFYIEDNDGNPTGYYNQDGEWVNKDGIHSPDEYNDVMKDELWANSYPSGHSAAISSTAMLLIELLPMQADKILAASNRFAVNRTIARYHWNSDTIQGRVLATCIAPIIRCCSDWNERFEKAKECLK